MKCPVCGADLNTQYCVGNIAKINNTLNHDNGYENQIGVITKVLENNYCYIVAFDKRSNRYWVCGFEPDEFSLMNTNIKELFHAYKQWRDE